MIESPALATQSGVRHGFFTRAGGVSEGIYAALNCGLGSGDDPARVRENRRRAMARIGLATVSLATLHQVHSARVVVVERPFAREARPHADGLVTRTRGVALGVLAADCAPVLLADAVAGMIGAAHAGWKGALAGVVEATVAAMVRLGARASAIMACVGPCIAQASYEVGPEFRMRFLAADAANERYFRPSPRTDHWQFDLPGHIAARLAALGLAGISILPLDTCADADRFFSYRRASLAGEQDYGRLLSAIALTP